MVKTREESIQILDKMISQLPESLKDVKCTFVVSGDIYFSLNKKSHRGHRIVNGTYYDLPEDYALLANSKDVEFAKKNYQIYKAIRNA